MTAFLRLYPRAWRERYGEELVALLEDHPATVFDQFDLIRGALDARLHPQVRGAAATEKENPVTQRLLGVLAAIGGLAWIIGFATAMVLPPDPYGDPDTSLARYGVAIGSCLIGIALGELGTRPGSRSWTGHAISVAGVILGLTVIFDYPWFIIGLVGIPLLIMLGAARGYQARSIPVWSVAVIGVASVAALVGVFGTGGGLALFALMGAVGFVIALVTFRPPTRVVPGGPSQEPA
jgi:hypothetical protein